MVGSFLFCKVNIIIYMRNYKSPGGISMGKACSAIMGIGIAGAIIGMHAYMFLTPEDKCDVKEEFKDIVNDLKKAADRITEAV